MENYTGLEIAVIGLSCRFPNSKNAQQFWSNLKHGKDCISDITNIEAMEEGESKALIDNPLYIKSSAYLANKNNFDSAFFNYRPDEAELMDPQMRVYHECCWEAMEDSGYSSKEHKETIGVFSSATPNLPWLMRAALKNKDGHVDKYSAKQLSDISFLSTKISYLLDLKGPAIFINTACSSSLVAIHEASSSLLLGECSMALAGGVTIQNYSKKGYVYQEGMIFSKDGKCRPYDKESSGTVSGEGVGVVVLKRLKDALNDRDNIYAIIKGSAINNDGNRKVGYTAPSAKGQVEAIKKAQKMAGIKPSSINFVEGHGTATELGDPIEIEALNAAFNDCLPKSCMLGSVKSNIGHVDSAAGVAGFIKAVLSIKHREVPPTLHFKSPNPRIAFDQGPFFVNNDLVSLENEKDPLRAGISSFGIGGTNAHVIIEEAPRLSPSSSGRPYQLLALSAQSPSSLEANTTQLKTFLEKDNKEQLPDIAYTLLSGRKRLKYRKIVVAQDQEHAAKVLGKDKASKSHTRIPQEELQNKVFMFPGQGTQYINMCKDLYLHEKAFREQLTECLNLAKHYSPVDFESILFAETANDQGNKALINETKYAQPLLFMVEYSLAKMLIEWGVRPDYMIGHSIGEYAAACISGVFDLQDALRLVIKRGELMNQAQRGSMLSLSMPQAQVVSLLGKVQGIDLAVVNSKEACVVSGEDDAINSFAQFLEKEGHASKVLHTSHAFHSYMMEEILTEFENEVAAVSIHEPKIPYISNLTGVWVQYEQLKESSYWSNQLRRTVQFLKGTETLLAEGAASFIELGPGKTLCNYISENPDRKEFHHLINFVRHPRQVANDQEYLTEKLGQLWLKGIDIDWKKYYQNEKRNRVSLPTYVFDPIPYPADFDHNKLFDFSIEDNPFDLKKQEVPLVHVSNWIHSASPNEATELKQKRFNILVFADKYGLSKELLKACKKRGQRVIEIRPSLEYREVDPNLIEINLSEPSHFLSMWNYFSAQEIEIHNILYCSAIDKEARAPKYEDMEERFAEGYLGFAYLAQSIALSNQSQRLNLTVFNNFLANVTEADELDPLKATIHGPVKIIPSELLNVRSKLVDVPFPFKDKEEGQQLVKKLINEVFYDSEDPFVAYRYNERWVKSFSPLVENDKTHSGVSIVEGASYIITGGFGGMGFAIANDLVHKYGAHVILVHRSPFPARETWDEYLNTHNNQDKKRIQIEQLIRMESTGAKVDLYQVDVSVEAQVKNFLEEIQKRKINVNGLIWTAGEIDLGGVIQNRKKQEFLSYLSSKVDGVLLFEKYMNFKELEFISLFSSIGSIFYQANFGMLAYNASNEFLESFACYYRRKFGIHAITINWCDWYDVGMSVKSIMLKEKMDDVNLINSSITDGIYPDEGVQVFYKCLHSKVPLTTIFKGNLLEAINERTLEFNQIRETLSLGAISESAGNETGDNIEEQVVELYAQFFGKSDLTPRDDFFELGGDSLKAMTLVARINKKFGANLSIKDIFSYPMIGELVEEVLNTNSAKSHKINPAPRAENYALSSAQTRMYFLQMLEKESTAYNEVRMFEGKGELDRSKLELAFNKLIERHESLRTIFVNDSENPRQKIVTDVRLSLEFLKYEENSLEETIDSFIQPFDLSQAPLCRVGIVEKSEAEFLILVDMHHIINDEASFGIFMQELVSLYNGETLPDIDVQYKDYSEWVQSDERTEVKTTQKQFWIDEFQENLLLDLPTDFPRPKEKNYRGERINFQLQEAETNKLRQLAKETGVSLYMLLLSMYNVFLSKLSGQEDITLGTVTSGREHSDLEQVIGMFANTLPLRYFPKGELSMKDFILEVKARTLKYFENQAYPYEELIDELQVSRDRGRNPLFDVFFSYYRFEETSLDMKGLELSPYTNSKFRSSKFDMTLWVAEFDDKLEFDFEYAQSLFKADTIKRFITYFKNILQVVSKNIDTKISAIEILPQEEKQMLLHDFNATEVEYPANKTVLDLFTEQVEKTPDRIALVYKDERFTYRELSKRINQLARYLREKGIKSDSKVGVMIERSPEMMIGILGTVKAGGAYIPIDPSYPEERIQYILADSSAQILLVNEAPKESLKIEGEIVKVNDKKILALSGEELPNINKPEDLIYIIYTSGSTGKPKGVMIEHRTFMNLIHWFTSEFDIDQEENILLVAPVSFDLSMKNLFSSLIKGGKLTLMPEPSTNYPLMEEIIEKDRISFLNCSPSAFYPLLDKASLGDYKALRNLKKVFLGGEPIALEKIRSWSYSTNYNGTKVINTYGPTEFTDTVSAYQITKEDMENGRAIPIGKPAWNDKFYIVDKHHKLVPIGVAGELCLSGVGRARGYLNKEALTDEKFIPCPFNVGSYTYKTGDLAKWLPNGQVVFLGRVDNQVKIRGFRIEPGEIESFMNSHTDIGESIVTIKEKQGDKFLVAYYTSPRQIPLAELRSFVSQKLPDHMVPAFFVHLEQLPLTPSGKVNRKALPEPEIQIGNDFQAPTNEVEDRLAYIWSEVLGIDKGKIGNNTNFFEVGGNSLNLLKVNNRINAAFDLNISAANMFRLPTIAAFADFIANGDTKIREFEKELDEREETLSLIDTE